MLDLDLDVISTCYIYVREVKYMKVAVAGPPLPDLTLV